MAKVKASDMLIVKKLLQEARVEPKLLAACPADVLRTYQTAGATSWIELAHEAHCLEIAARVLYGGDPEGLRRLGREVARHQFRGIYKVFLAIPSVEFIVKRVSSVWRTQYDEGEARVEDLSHRSAVLVAAGLPDMTPVQREYVCGYLQGILELTGAQQVRVSKQELDPQAWRWSLSWE